LLVAVVELQLLMAGGTAADAVEEQTPATPTPILLAGWEWFSGGAAPDDDARVGLLSVLAHRLNKMLMLMVARWRKGEDDELLSPLLMPSLAIPSTLEQLLKATAEEPVVDPDPRRELGELAEHLRHTADVLESMTPAEHLKPDRRQPAAAFRHHPASFETMRARGVVGLRPRVGCVRIGHGARSGHEDTTR
jgi:hypothetical protein